MVSIHKFYSDGAWVDGASVAQLDVLAASAEDIRAIAAMPDLHPGKYGPVGVGMLSERIHPPIIGSDIGCGMGLFRTDLKVRKAKLERIAERLHALDAPWDGDVSGLIAAAGLPASLYDGGLGTIGSGNHFCELQAIETVHDAEAAEAAGLDEAFVHVLVHSGSRALGYSVLDGILAAGTPVLDADSEAGAAYLAAHDHALAWARLNRAGIAARAAEAARTTCAPVVDVSHNFLERTPQGILHRKGAAPSDRGLVPIPGSRDSLSYLVKPNPDASPDALACLAHGAGRKYDRGSMHGRIQNVKSVRERMTKNQFGGIVVCEDRNLLIEEAGDAYKNIVRVIDDLVALGLASVVATFRPLVTFKTGLAHIGDKGRR